MLGFIKRHLNAKKIEAERDKFRDILISLRSKNDSLEFEKNKLKDQNNALRDELSGLREENKRIDELYEENARLKVKTLTLTAAIDRLKDLIDRIEKKAYVAKADRDELVAAIVKFRAKKETE